MTSISARPIAYLPGHVDVVVNGRHVATSSRILGIESSRSGEWLVRTFHATYTIFGGKAAGGGSREWFVDIGGKTPIRVSSAAEAVRIIESM